MKIGIATVQVPFVRGGAEELADNLQRAFIERGHEAEIISMPLMDGPINFITDSIVASRLMDINRSWGGKIDLCIGLKFPAYCMPHDNKVVWALHQHRAAYELFNTDLSGLKNNEEGRFIRDAIINADNKYLGEAKRIYTISKNVTGRLKKFNNINSTPLYHPCPSMEKFYSRNYDDYILMPSRISPTKRQMLALKALLKTKSDIKLYVMGRPDNDVIKKEFFGFIEKNGLKDRVVCFDYVAEEKKLELYANARAVIFIPVDEDYGYITLEAMSAEKPVITVTDSGGPLEFIVNGECGIVVEPNEESIAEAIDMFADSENMAKEFGKKAKKRLSDMDISWDYVVKELTK